MGYLIQYQPIVPCSILAWYFFRFELYIDLNTVTYCLSRHAWKWKIYKKEKEEEGHKFWTFTAVFTSKIENDGKNWILLHAVVSGKCWFWRESIELE